MLKEAHYWAEIRGDDSLLNSFSLGLSLSLPFFFFVSFYSLFSSLTSFSLSVGE